jgi:dTDP-L-rhamnose 4-epimerase
MYEVTRYERVNIGGTANLLQAISTERSGRLQKLVVASSRAVYGEGCYLSPSGAIVFPLSRTVEDMRAGQFEPRDPATGELCTFLPTREDAKLHPTSFYGLTKQVQEQMCLMWGRTLGFSAVALRYQNVYGPGQSLKNPYTGILAIFSNQARAGKPIYIFEDGCESRDFVYIADVVQATTTAVLKAGLHNEALNVGSGVSTTVSEVVNEIVTYFASRSEVSITGAFRQGDIRHCVADLERAGAVLGYSPQWSFHDGVREFLSWAATNNPTPDGYAASLKEMKECGLYHE